MIYLLTAIGLTPGGSSTVHIYTHIHQQYKKHSTNNTKHSKYQCTYYQNTHTLQNPHIHTRTHYKTHTYTHPHIIKQVKTTNVQVKTTTIQDIP
jgi:hypothetical protein